MNILICRPGQSKSADDLVAALIAAGHTARRERTAGEWTDGKSVGWGLGGCWLNHNAGRGDKLQELTKLARAGVPVPEVRLPHTLSRADLRQTVTFSGASSPLWLGRTPHHAKARDLRRPRAVRRNVTYYTRREDIVEEYRCHVFRNHRERRPQEYLVVRSGKKVPEDSISLPWSEESGESTRPSAASRSQFQTPARTAPRSTQHSSWIRSRLSGWLISYDGVTTTGLIRETCKNAAAALDLDFCAVDLGCLRNGSVVVLEVNTAPSLDNPNTARVYAQRVAALCQLVR